jgi:hypothetical protein
MATSPERRAEGAIQTRAMEKLVPGISKSGEKARSLASLKLKARSGFRSLVLDTPFEDFARKLIRRFQKN